MNYESIQMSNKCKIDICIIDGGFLKTFIISVVRIDQHREELHGVSTVQI